MREKGLRKRFLLHFARAQSIRHRATKPKLDDFLDFNCLSSMLSVAVLREQPKREVKCELQTKNGFMEFRRTTVS